MIKLLKNFFSTLAGVMLLLLLSIYFFQEKLIFHPDIITKDYKYAFEEPFEEVFLNTSDGHVINALHFKVSTPKGVILYFHGNAGNLISWGYIANDFVQYGYEVFIMDYRGFGKSTGKPDEDSLYDDAQICYDYLKQAYDENKIVIYGRSLGSAFAVKVAAENHPGQLLLEAPFYNLKDMANYRNIVLPGFLFRYHFPSNTFVKKVLCPVTIFHGNEDRVVPFSSGEKLFQEMDMEKKRLIKIEEGNHHNLSTFKLYRESIEMLLQ